uniref:Uncharacterized protein n=1 Tax=Plectus sambesii TaxID=2011161 RepID=A0A914XJZ8_9BILA
MSPNVLTACYILAKPLTKKLHICHAPTSQIELIFESTSTSREFWIRVLSPTGEKSPMLYFNVSGQTHRFAPRIKACGHGNWQVVIYRRAYDQPGLHYRLTSVKTLPLNGVGVLRFKVGNDLMPKIDSRLWIEQQPPRSDNVITGSVRNSSSKKSVVQAKTSVISNGWAPLVRTLKKQNSI